MPTVAGGWVAASGVAAGGVATSVLAPVEKCRQGPCRPPPTHQADSQSDKNQRYFSGHFHPARGAGIVQYLVGAFMSLMILWLDSGARLSPQQVDAMFRSLSMAGITPLCRLVTDP